MANRDTVIDILKMLNVGTVSEDVWKDLCSIHLVICLLRDIKKLNKDMMDEEKKEGGTTCKK